MDSCVAAWYRELKSSLSPQHPLLKLLVEQQLRNRLCCAFYPEEPWKLRQEELAYLQVLDGTDAEYEEVTISPVFLRQWLNDVVRIFTQLQMCQNQLAPLLDEVMGKEQDNQGGSCAPTLRCSGKIYSIGIWWKAVIRPFLPAFISPGTTKYTGMTEGQILFRQRKSWRDIPIWPRINWPH